MDGHLTEVTYIRNLGLSEYEFDVNSIFLLRSYENFLCLWNGFNKSKRFEVRDRF